MSKTTQSIRNVQISVTQMKFPAELAPNPQKNSTDEPLEWQQCVHKADGIAQPMSQSGIQPQVRHRYQKNFFKSDYHFCCRRTTRLVDTSLIADNLPDFSALVAQMLQRIASRSNNKLHSSHTASQLFQQLTAIFVNRLILNFSGSAMTIPFECDLINI